MKELPGEVPNRVARILPKYPATFTHGMPGLVIGGAIAAGALLLNHIVSSIWETLPDLLSIGLLAFGIGWLFSLVRGTTLNLIKDEDAAETGIFFAVILSVVGFVSFFVAWCAGHPSPPGPVQDVSCKNHGGLLDRKPRPEYDSQVLVSCQDGYTFIAP